MAESGGLPLDSFRASPTSAGAAVIRVLVVDDSLVVRQLLTEALSGEPDIQIVGFARDGNEGVLLAERLKPDVITMDIMMPGLNGVEATRRIMEKSPTAIVVMSSAPQSSTDRLAFDAMQAGALAIILKPKIGSEFSSIKNEILTRIRLMSQVKVVKREARASRRVERPIQLPAAPSYKIRLIAIGSSTGGPAALQTIFSHLPARVPVPVIVAQHMTPGFMSGMVEWLASSSTNPLKLAEHGELMRPGYIYIAPEGFHTGVTIDGKIALEEGPEIDGARPSVNHLFSSVADAYGPMALALLLTGMGSDGVRGLARIKAMGGKAFAQDQSTSVVFGMPQQAIQEGVVDKVLRLDEMAGAVMASLT